MVAAAIGATAAVAGTANSIAGGGSKGGGSSGSATTVQNQLDPDIKQRLLSLMDRAQGVADTPYTPYTGQRVAGLTPDQLAGYQQVRDYSSAGIAPNQYAQGVTADETSFDAFAGPTSIPELDLSEYLNPFTDLVASRVEDQMRRFGAISDREADAKAAMTGAFGGDRAGIVKTEMERNRLDTLGNTLAGLYKGGYDSATSLATGDLNRRLDAGVRGAGIRLGAAQQLAGLGAQEQALGLQGAAALESVGAQNQQQLQRNLDVGYSDYLDAREHPFRTTNFLNSVVSGSPLTNEGTKTTTAPGPSALGQIAGLGAAGIGLLGQSGSLGANNWLSNLFSGGSTPAWSSYSFPDVSSTNPGISAGAGSFLARGGMVRVKPYQDGGFVDFEAEEFGAPVAGIGEPVDQEYANDLSARALDDQAGIGHAGEDEADLYAEDDTDDEDGVPPAAGIGAVDMAGSVRDQPQGQDRAAAPAGIGQAEPVARPAGVPEPGIGSVRQVQASLRRGVGQPEAKGQVPSWALPLTVAGFSMLASKSPNALSAVGEGGIAGMRAYVEGRKLDALDQHRRDQIEAKREQVRQTGLYRAGQLQNAADKNQVARQTLEAKVPLTQSQIEANKARAAASRAAAARHFDSIGTGRWSAPVAGEGVDENGAPVRGAYTLDHKSGTMKFMPGAVITGRGGAGGGKTALEKNTEYVAQRLARGAGRDEPTEEDRSAALRMVQQGKGTPPEQRARLEFGILRDLRAQDSGKPRGQRRSEEQLRAEASREVDRLLQGAREAQSGAPAAAVAPATSPATPTPPATAPSRPRPSAAPSAAPPGMSAVGRTPDGRTVYQDESGRRFAQ